MRAELKLIDALAPCALDGLKDAPGDLAGLVLAPLHEEQTVVLDAVVGRAEALLAVAMGEIQMQLQLGVVSTDCLLYTSPSPRDS